MKRIIDKGLNELHEILIRMSNIAYEALSSSIEGCLNNVSEYDRINELSNVLIMMYGDAENKAFRLIARFQPVASDLRTIISYMKIAYDLIRFGRYAYDIAYISRKFGGLRDCEEWIYNYMRIMSEKVLYTVKISTESLKNHDARLARSIAEFEEDIDEMYIRYLDKLLTHQSTTTECTIPTVMIIRYLERIADHATYICESVYYMITGEKILL